MSQQRNNLGQFIKGSNPWNKNTTGIMKPNKTSFTKNSVKRSNYSIPRLSKRDGYIITSKNILIPIKDRKSNKIYMHHKRIPYAQFILEQAGFTIPKNHIIYHIDHNNQNNNITNLEIISRAELLKRNQKRGI